MKRVVTVTTAFVLASTCLLVGTAASQETTTTEPEVTTTTEASPTTVADTVPETTTTVADTVPETTTTVPETTTTVPVESSPLPGQLLAEGSLNIDVRFAESPDSNCTRELPVAGGQFNVARDDAGDVGGFYGLVPTGSGTAGAYVVGLGAMPVGVGIVSVSDGQCEFDAVGIGTWSSSAGLGRVSGVGAGVHPGVYEDGQYVSKFVVEAQVGAAGGPAVVDVQAAADFLLRQRPGFDVKAAIAEANAG